MSFTDKDKEALAKEGLARRTFDDIEEGNVLFMPSTRESMAQSLNIAELKPARDTPSGDFFEYIVLAKDPEKKTLTTVLVGTLDVKPEKLELGSAFYSLVPVPSRRGEADWAVKYTSDSQTLAPEGVKRWACTGRAFQYKAHAGTSAVTVCKDVQFDAESVRKFRNAALKNETTSASQSRSQSGTSKKRRRRRKGKSHDQEAE